MGINYKNVVSVQQGITAQNSGYTTASYGVAAVDIIKHKGFILVPDPLTTAAMTVFPTYFGSDGNSLAGHTLTAGNPANGTRGPVEVPLRMKSFTGLTGGSILFVV